MSFYNYLIFNFIDFVITTSTIIFSGITSDLRGLLEIHGQAQILCSIGHLVADPTHSQTYMHITSVPVSSIKFWRTEYSSPLTRFYKPIVLQGRSTIKLKIPPW